MTKTVDEIGTAIPRGRMRKIGRKRLVVEEQQFPDADVAADVERERHIVIAYLAGDGRQRLQIAKEIAYVFRLRVRIGGVGKGREKVRARRRDAFHHGVDEIA